MPFYHVWFFTILATRVAFRAGCDQFSILNFQWVFDGFVSSRAILELFDVLLAVRVTNPFPPSLINMAIAAIDHFTLANRLLQISWFSALLSLILNPEENGP